jgi:hypothetical protein
MVTGITEKEKGDERKEGGYVLRTELRNYA